MKVEMIVKRKKVEFEAMVEDNNCRLYGAMRYNKTDANPTDWLDSSTLSLFLTDVFAKMRDHKEIEIRNGEPSTHGYSRIVEFRCEPIETTAILLNTPYEPGENETTTKNTYPGETNEI